ncbi:MAG: hypothetical protein LKH27_08200 [Prevotella sp.]|nr:hypothetical protein [Prevotella sp.]MCH3993020.1 hypothetical protein [Prevotella sp.]MCI1474379.1 hypothetical protein [Prevotella sp.]MCI1596066.1 hypothetical protein [Prevotella sp.]
MNIDIINNFSRPRDGLLMVYLSAKAKNGIVESTLNDLSFATGWSIKQLRTSIDCLVKGNLIGKDKFNGVTVLTIAGKTKPVVKSKPKPNNIEERKDEFYKSLIPFVNTRGGIYPPSMIREFFEYWSEPNKSKSRMRFENEKTWDINLRLKNWSRRENDFGNTKVNNEETEKLKQAVREDKAKQECEYKKYVKDKENAITYEEYLKRKKCATEIGK